MSLDFSWTGKQRETQGKPLLPLGLLETQAKGRF